MTRVEQERRASLRVPVHLDVTLSRGRGTPIRGSTLDLGAGGARISCSRPLGVDELLAFQLPLAGAGEQVDGRARVLREYANNVYALRFEGLRSDATARLLSFVSRKR
jgi:PilZ domain-containing protein